MSTMPPAGRTAGRMGRFLMLTGPLLSLIVFGLALLAHNRLYSNDLGRAARLETRVRGALDARREPGARQASPTHALEADEAALRQPPDRTPLDALLLYDENERRAFAATRWVDNQPPVASRSGLAAPADLRAVYEAGAVSLDWSIDPATRVALADGLPGGERLAQRVYRSVSGAPAALRATLDLETTRWRDDALPLAGGDLTYSVWTVLLQDDPLPDSAPGAAEGLVRSECSELVTVSVPEHFRLVLVSGDSTRAAIRLEVGPTSRPVAVQVLDLVPGDPVAAGALSTGLVLQALDVIDTERLTTRTHLLFTSDASLVLDPVTRAPRTSESQILMPCKRLVATLRGPSGAARSLELDLP